MLVVNGLKCKSYHVATILQEHLVFDSFKTRKQEVEQSGAAQVLH